MQNYKSNHVSRNRRINQKKKANAFSALHINLLHTPAVKYKNEFQTLPDLAVPLKIANTSRDMQLTYTLTSTTLQQNKWSVHILKVMLQKLWHRALSAINSYVNYTALYATSKHWKALLASTDSDTFSASSHEYSSLLPEK